MTTDSNPPAGADRRRLVLGGLAACLGPTVAAAAPASPSAAVPARAAGACVPATFWQPLLVDRDRPAHHWLPWMEALRTLGVSRLVVQHVALEPYDVLVPGAAPDDPGRRFMSHLLAAAQRHRVRLWIGLSYDPAHYAAVASDDPTRVQAYLQVRLQRLRRLAALLAPTMRHPAVRGWYLSDEIDDLSWAQPSRADMLATWLAEATRLLRAAAPGARIAISGFVNATHTTPAELARQWRRWFAAAPALDEVLFQDGVGVGKVALDQCAAYLAAMSEAAAAAGRRHTPVVELFEAAPATAAGLAGAPDAPWRPASIERVARQIEIARSAARSWVAFSVPEYAGLDTLPSRALREALVSRCLPT